ncbi:unnamed protein product, partial [Amoebophrya sp. A25]
GGLLHGTKKANLPRSSTSAAAIFARGKPMEDEDDDMFLEQVDRFGGGTTSYTSTSSDTRTGAGAGLYPGHL